MSTTYFSERERGPRPRMAEAISQPVRRALLRQIQLGIENGSYGWRFPEQCGDERGPCGTDERAFWDTAAAEVPDLVPTENLIRTVRVTDCADVGPANDGNVSIAAVHSVNVDEWLASFGRSSGRRAACTVFRRRPSMAVVRPRDDGSCGAGRPRAASQ